MPAGRSPRILAYAAALAALLAGAAGLSGCGGGCGPSNCMNGCCDANNVCQLPSADHCGGAGGACLTCVPGQVCASAACAFPSSGGGASGGSTTSGSTAAGGSSGSSSTGGSTGTTTGGATSGGSTGNTSTTTGSSTTGSSGTTTGTPSAVLWQVDRLQSGEQLESLVAGQNLVVTSWLGTPRILALDDDGHVLYDVDLSAALPNDVAAGSTADLAVEDDGTVVASINGGATDELVHLSSSGAVLWHANVSTATFAGMQKGILSHPAIATDGTIYVSSTYGDGSNDPLPQLAAFGEDGALKFQLDVTTDAERGSSGVAPGMQAPWIAMDGTVKFLTYTGQGPMIRTVDPAQKAVTTNVALPSNLDAFDLEPLTDGTWMATILDTTRTIQGCGGLNFQSQVAHFAADGTILWATDVAGEEWVEQPVLGRGGEYLVAWGNCYDGSGAGAYVLSPSGQVTATFGDAYGDGVQVLGTSTNQIYLLVQNDEVNGTETGPVIDVLDHATGALQQQIPVSCSPAGNASDVNTRMVALSSGKLAVICDENPDQPGGGGIYGLDVATSAASGATLPYWDGSAQGTRRTGN